MSTREQINIRASEAFVRRLDAFATARGLNRTEAIRAAVMEASESPEGVSGVPDRDELLQLLGESARNGNVSAMKTLLEEHRRGNDDEKPAVSAIDQLAAKRAARG